MSQINEMILPGTIHEIKMLRSRLLVETIPEEERKDLEYRLWKLEEEQEIVTN